jgi:hypothetical protein
MSDNQKAHDIATTVAWMRAEIERLRARVEVLEPRGEVLERVREAALPHLFQSSMETGIALLKAVQEAKP